MLKKRLALNFGANLYVQLVNVIVQIGSVPLFLSFWSKERYGAWILISSIPACLSIGEAGFATSSANEVSMAMAHGNRERALRSLHTAWGFLVAISVVLSAAGVISFFAVPWERWLNPSEVTIHEIRWTVLLLVLFTIAGILIAIFRAIYRAAYKNARFTVVTTSGNLAESIGMGVAVVFTHSMVCAAALMLIMRLLLFAALLLDRRNFASDLHLGLSAFSFAELKQSWRPSVMFMANTLGSAIYIQGLTLLVGAGLGAAAVVVFNTTRTMTRVIVQFVAMIQLSVWPEFSYLFGVGDFTRARRLNELAFEVSWTACLILAVMIYVVAPWLMPLWTHHAVRVDQSLLVIFLTSAVLNGLWSVTAGLLMGTNQHQGLTLRYLVAATFSIILGASSVHYLGIYGVALAMIACELIMLPYAISRTCQLLRQPVKELIYDSVQLRVTRHMLGEYYQRRLAKVG
jgi:O-antigen/teichoic acid export membrane protein